jgi:hypothetical protein
MKRALRHTDILGSVVTTAIACVFVVAATAALAGTARTTHSRKGRAALKEEHPVTRQATSEVLTSDRQILVRLEARQRAFEEHSQDNTAALSRQISQLSSAVEDSRKDMQKLLEQNAKMPSTQRLPTIVFVLLVAIGIGLVYIVWQLQRLTAGGVGLKGEAAVAKWNGKVPDFPDDRELGKDEEGIVSFRPTKS